MNSNSEIWKPVPGFEGYYEVSNMGRVKSLSRVVNAKSHGKPIKRNTGDRIIKGGRTGRAGCGYLRVTLCNGKEYKDFILHRLVAQVFIPNPNNLPCINHKDENPANNCVDNLEWCTHAYNDNYGHRNENISKGKDNPNYGRHHSEETKRKMREAALKREAKKRREKICQAVTVI